MLKAARIALGVVTIGTASFVASPTHAMGFAISEVTLDGTAYGWYANDIPLWFANPDGFSYDPNNYLGYRAYLLFQGTAASVQGHCLELTTGPGATTPNPDTRIFVVDHDVLRSVNDDYGGTLQSKARLWIGHTAGPSLPWIIHLEAYSDQQNQQDFKFQIERVEVDEPGCTTGQTLPWAAVKGTGSSYTVTLGNTY
jgi:hypothetical protein